MKNDVSVDSFFTMGDEQILRRAMLQQHILGLFMVGDECFESQGIQRTWRIRVSLHKMIRFRLQNTLFGAWEFMSLTFSFECLSLLRFACEGICGLFISRGKARQARQDSKHAISLKHSQTPYRPIWLHKCHSLLTKVAWTEIRESFQLWCG